VLGNNIILSNHISGGGNLYCSDGGIIRNNFIENCNGNGLEIMGAATVSGNRIINCKQSGIVFQGANTRVSNNTITGCGFGSLPDNFPYLNAGIVSLTDYSPIDSNVVANNTIGVICGSTNLLTNNNIYNNRDFDFRVLGNLSGDITAPNNWWGTTDTAQIQEKIYDFNDYNIAGKLLIDPIATDSIPGAGAK
jgi:parallel beta-helix repeat protein